MIKIFYHPYIWQIKPHRGKDGNTYLQDMDIKPKWIAGELNKIERKPIKLIKSKPLNWNDYYRVHTRRYVDAIIKSDPRELSKYSWITWSKSFLRSQRHISGAIYQAAIEAINSNVSGVLAVEGHHALPDKGAGFCTFNNLAVAITKLLDEKIVRKVMVVDLDLHLGDGTITIFKDNPQVFIFDIFGQKHLHSVNSGKLKNLASHKVKTKQEYFATLAKLKSFLDKYDPEIAFYIAGMDVYENDRYGGISGMDNMAISERDQIVFEFLKKRQIPTVFTSGGGYVKYKDPAGKILNLKHITQKRKFLTMLHLSTILNADKVFDSIAQK